MIGRKFVLWRMDYNPEAYDDQFGFKHPAYIVSETHVVTIMQSRRVPGSYRPLETSLGYLAVSDTGKVFTYNWERHDETTTNPFYVWDLIEDDNGAIWQPRCAIQTINNRFMYKRFPHINTNGITAIPPHSKHCAKHNEYHYEWEQCWRCQYNLPPQIKVER